MKAVILAGGLGTRLQEETSLKPKPMVEIGGRPILWHIMKIYTAHGINEFIICLGYKGYMIKDFFANYSLHTSDVTIDMTNGAMEVHKARTEPWRVSLIDTGDSTMTGGRLRRVAHLLDETFCMTYGDGLSDIDIGASITFHRDQGRKATVAAVLPPGRFGSLQLEDAAVSAFVEKPHGDGGRINGGFFVLEPSALDYAGGDRVMWEQDPMAGLVRDGELSAYTHDGFWQPMDTLRDRQLLDNLWSRPEGAPWKCW